MDMILSGNYMTAKRVELGTHLKKEGKKTPKILRDKLDKNKKVVHFHDE